MLDPQIKTLLEADANKGYRPVEELSVPEAREQIKRMLLSGSKRQGCQAIDKMADHLPCRFYAPNRNSGGSPLGLVVFYHGGGFVVGDLDTHDNLARRICVGSGCAVLSVGYRLAPESRFPGPVEDCFGALLWAREHAGTLGCDAERIAVAGDSAGGTLAAVVALRARDAGGPALRGQVLLYPATDHYTAGHASYEQNATGYGLTRNALKWFYDHYLKDPRDAMNSDACPLRAETLAGLPPAFIAVAEYDVLRDEGAAYARRLASSGVETDFTLAKGMVHGFMRMTEHVDVAREIFDRCDAWISRRLVI
jgi:acetyl esterase